MSGHTFAGGLPTTPAPVIDPETQPYWDGAEAGELVLPFCLDCEEYFWYPRGFCPRCTGSRVRWDATAGEGEIYSYSIVRRSFGQWKEHVPFVIAWVTLDEGISVSTNIIDIDEDDLAIGARVSATFERRAPEDRPILRFAPK